MKRIPFLSLLTITSFISLHAMETQLDQDWNLYKQLRTKSIQELETYRQLNDINKAIDLAECAKDGHLMAKLMHVCLPQEVIKQHIAPHLATLMATKYKHKIISGKNFKIEPINYGNEGTSFIQHDGKYHLIPKMNNGYTLWDGSDNRRTTLTFPNNNNIYSVERFSPQTKDDLLYTVTTLANHEKKQLIIIKHKEEQSLELITHAPIKEFLFSSDGLTLVTSKENDRMLDLFHIPSSSFQHRSLHARITTLCAAHHLPLFAVGINRSSANLVIINPQINESTYYTGNTNPIISMEFSPDDTQLLTCSNNEELNTYQIKVSGTKNFNTILYNTEQNGQILRAFFINNGEQIVVIKKGSFIDIHNILHNSLNKHPMHWAPFDSTKKPLIIGSNKHKILISFFNRTITFHKTTTGKRIGFVPSGKKCIGLGLPVNENSIILMDEKEKAYRMELYDANECDTIDFIEKKANIIQLYEMLALYKQHQKCLYSNFSDSKRAQGIVQSINSYIHQQHSSSMHK